MTNTSSDRARLTMLLRDVALPMALFYVLRSFDVDALWALLVSALPPAIRSGYVLVRHRRIDAIGAFVLAVLVVNGAVALISGDPRLLLVRSAWVGLLLGGLMLGSLVVGRRPFLFRAIGTLQPARAAELEAGWAAGEDFRRPWRTMTLWWGVGGVLLGCAVVLMAFTLPVDVVPFLDTALTVGCLLLGMKLTRKRLMAGINRTVDA
ncbi:VC0807 family protein [Amycolatopsis sp., V23-08]|uniref:VC0807 family protein n=1 Tax=Amycolatopsis heterodermiae TaxID=3110235 RepID=A0ABU5RMV9_9PSEU|nr:VC0807 family protein [Amycolatopsis sp., V23-08]MEA5367642.1 VC0807 family protein [Amycolatopsis sp., V23-08]